MNIRLSKRFVAAVAALLLFVVGCHTLVSGVVRSPRDWQFVQSVGGLALDAPKREARGHVLLPVRCNVSGLQTITVRPTTVNSALWCDAPLVRVRSGTILLTVRTNLAGHRRLSARCPDADLGTLAAGEYPVFYLSPDGSRQPLGSVSIPH